MFQKRAKPDLSVYRYAERQARQHLSEEGVEKHLFNVISTMPYVHVELFSMHLFYLFVLSSFNCLEILAVVTFIVIS